MKTYTYEDWVIDTLLQIIKTKPNYRGNYHDQGYIYVIKAFIDNYSSIYYCPHKFGRSSRQHFNFFWDHLNRGNYFVFNSLLMSANAQKILKKSANAGKDPKPLKKELHFEHITPKGYSFNKLIALKPETATREAVKACFKYAKLILITKEEATFLDGTGQRFTEQDYDYLVSTHYASVGELKEAHKLIGASLKSNGSGLVRAAYLEHKGVEFVNYGGEKADWRSYLFDDNAKEISAETV